MNTCTKVFLRKKEISGDRISLYLDFYPPIRNPHTNRLSRRESLGIYLYGHPANAREREFNASMMEKAEAIRCRRFEQLLNEQFGLLDKEKPVSFTHLRAHETGLGLVCRLLLEKKNIHDST